LSEFSEVSEKSLYARTDCSSAAIVSFTYINVSQGSVATQFRCGGIINTYFIANFPQSVPVKEFLKSVNIWRRYGQKYGGMFFLTHGVYMYDVTGITATYIRLLYGKRVFFSALAS